VAAMTFDPLSPGFAQDPYSVYAALRAQPGPQYFAGFDVWLLSRFDDVSAAALNPKLVRTLDGIAAPAAIAAQKRAANWHDMPFHSRFVQFSLLDSDGATHDRLRKLVLREFSPAAIARLKAETQTFVGALLDDALARGEIDFVEDFAAQIPGHIIGRMLGVPDVDCDRLRLWSENIVQYFDIDRSDEKKVLAENTTAEFYDYLKALAAERLRAPRDDIISTLAAAEQGGRMSHDEFISTCMLILMAGHGSTIDVMASGLHALLRFPAEMTRLRADLALMSGAVQEMFRYESPLPFFHRHAAEDIEIAGRRFARGEKLGLLYGAANRDPAKFVDPDRFDAARAPGRHLAFGNGAHFCLGNHVSRMDMEVVFTMLLNRTATIELLTPPVYKPGLSARGPQSLRVSLTPV
jgi:cytochrome P450